MKTQPVTEIILLCMASNFVSSHREHKVHNIVLYPDKHSWCNTTPIKQVVAYPGCSSVEIDNNVCVGACFSYSIPRTVPSAPGELIKPYCDSCQPSTVTWKHVTLECGGDETESSEVMQKSVQIITNCSCSTCDLGDDVTTAFSASGDGEIGPGHHKPSLLDDPMLMFRTQKKPSGASEHTGSNGANVASGNFSLITNDPVMNERLLLLLRQLGKDEDAEKLDKVVLRKLLRQVEGADHKVNQATLEEFVKNVEHRDHIKVNLEKLKHVLARLENDEMALPHHESASPESSTHRHHHHGSSGHGDNVMPPVVHHHHAVADPGDADSPTLDVAPHHFKPAIEGSELSYHDNLLQPSDADDPENTAREKNDDKDEEF